jgi:hypothetical protein
MARFAVKYRNRSSVTGVVSGAPFSCQSGISSVSARGSRTAPDVRADLAALFQQTHCDIGCELLETDGGGEAGWSGADHDNVEFHPLPRQVLITHLQKVLSGPIFEPEGRQH